MNSHVYQPSSERRRVVACAGRVIVLMGGKSAERAVSLRSGASVLAALRSAGVDAVAVDWQSDLLEQLASARADRVFIALHGRGGEDGCVQGALEVAGIPYTGSGVLGCALAMDKVRAKQVWRACGLPTPEFRLATDGVPLDETLTALGLPLMVKPAREGSSIGVAKVERAVDLVGAVADARRFDHDVLLERFVAGGEYTLSIVGGRALPIIKLETPRAFYDYEAKYHADSTRYLCPAGLTAAQEQSFAALGLRAFAALGAYGWGRVDFMVDADGAPWLIELNTVPGMTDHSLVPMAARRAGWSFEDLVIEILATSFREEG
jgi:D-alanine-D-alanine ligase